MTCAFALREFTASCSSICITMLDWLNPLAAQFDCVAAIVAASCRFISNISFVIISRNTFFASFGIMSAQFLIKKFALAARMREAIFTDQRIQEPLSP